MWKFKMGMKQQESGRTSSGCCRGDIRILGKNYRLILKKSETSRVELSGDEILVYSPGGNNSHDYPKTIEKWKGRMLRDYCGDIIRIFLKKLAVADLSFSVSDIPDIRLKNDARSLAGYGDTSGSLFVSPELYRFSAAGIEYVLACQLISLVYGEKFISEKLEQLLGDPQSYLIAYENEISEYLSGITDSTLI